jgi:small subunit ribosomal protein S14
MAKKSRIERNKKVKKLIDKYANKRAKLKKIANDRSLPWEVRLIAMIKLSELPKNSSGGRYRRRCSITGRPRGNHRYFGISRNMLRELASWGSIPGLLKSSW